MSRTTIAAIACWFVCGLALAVEIKDYQTRLEVADDGSAQGSATINVTGAKAGRLRLPVGFAELSDVHIASAPPDVTIEPGKSGRQAFIDVTFPENATAETTLSLTYRVTGVLYVQKPEEGQKSAFPAGSRLLRHAFVNTQETPIGQYRMTVLLPNGHIVHAIREQLPRPGRKEFQPRVELDRFAGRQGAQLQFSGLRQGDRTSMEMEVVEEQRSIFWLLALLPLALGYLFAFRDTVKSQPA